MQSGVVLKLDIGVLKEEFSDLRAVEADDFYHFGVDDSAFGRILLGQL